MTDHPIKNDEPTPPTVQQRDAADAEQGGGRRIGGLVIVRGVMGVVGVGVGIWGLRLLLQAVTGGALVRLPLWLGGAVVADDFLLIPFTVAVWLLPARSDAVPVTACAAPSLRTRRKITWL